MIMLILLIYFDVTITLSDLALHVVEKFADKKWEYYENLFNQNKLSLEDTITAQYSLIYAPKELILQEIDSIFKIRDFFKDFIEFISQNNLEIIIVSGGIDFVIQHVISSLGLSNSIKIVSVVTEYQSNNSLKVSRPLRFNINSLDFKSDLVQYYKNQGYIVTFIGDGSSDYNAVLSADIIYTVKDSKMSNFCKDMNLQHTEFESFSELLPFIKNKKFTS